MRVVLYTVVVSPHQIPLARELVRKVGIENFRYVYAEELQGERFKMGWWHNEVADWILPLGAQESEEWLMTADVVLSGQRDLDLFVKRAKRGLRTFYMGERWFKPISIGVGQRCRCSVPGWVRMFVPGYRRMAKRFVRWMNSDPNARCFTIGPWAKKDMLRIGVDESKIVPWGYFVAPSDQESKRHCSPPSSTSILKVLWVGRMLHWKRVDTIIRAVCELEKRCGGGQWKIQLTLVGDGPEKLRLQSLANRTIEQSNNQTITFLPSQPIAKIREIMREHDVYVLSSNAEEGWGAALNEALEEGMVAVGTCEAGSSATILGEEWLFHAGDYRRVAELLEECVARKRAGELRGQGIGAWSAEGAANRLLEIIGNRS